LLFDKYFAQSDSKIWIGLMELILAEKVRQRRNFHLNLIPNIQPGIRPMIGFSSE